MNIILSTEAIRPPLAGIGRYAWELATRLPLQADIESVRYLSDGLWTDLPQINSSTDLVSNADNKAVEPPPAPKLNYKGRMRQRLGRLPFVARAYGALIPLMASRQLNNVSKGIFHGPNYFVPNTRLPSVVTIHDLSVYRYPQWHPKARIDRMHIAIPQAIKRASLVLTDSLATRLEVIQEFSLQPDQVRAIPLGVDEGFCPRSATELTPVLARFGLQCDGYSLFVSTIEPRKNLLNLLAAYRMLPPVTRNNWPLVLVGGEGWQSEEIHHQIDRAVTEGWLKYLGFVDEQFLPLLYAGCRLFTYPSWYEGFGLPIAEAMASGVPVLTSNCSSMPEVAAGAAMLVEPGDVTSIHSGLKKALEDNQWRAMAISKGLQRAAELTWDACVKNTVTAYKMVQKS
ncbi:glycosyltransferase family 4 protein [Undibacterium sp. Rencai35W]|uniref:glycosyltransferase family 4 protein n=1 Tax=Undibacterium sp. Rencai35W TaxID=3413046 RepID=UPI003BF07C09